MFWGSAVDMGRVSVAQKACVRAVFRMKCRNSCKEVFGNRNILTFSCIGRDSPKSFVADHKIYQRICTQKIKDHYDKDKQTIYIRRTKSLLKTL